MDNENRFDDIGLNAPDIVKDNKSVSLDKVNELISEAKREVFQETRNEITKQVQTDRASLITVFGLLLLRSCH
jgi:hypothetical protein